MCKLEFYRNVSGERQERDIGSKSGQKSGQAISLDLPATATKSGQRDRGRKTANQLLFFVSFTKTLFCFHHQGFLQPWSLRHYQMLNFFLYFYLAQFFCVLSRPVSWPGLETLHRDQCKSMLRQNRVLFHQFQGFLKIERFFLLRMQACWF